jgi:hypothetical protein
LPESDEQVDAGTIANAFAVVIIGWTVLTPLWIPAVWLFMVRVGLRPTVSLCLLIPVAGFFIVVYYLAYSAWFEQTADLGGQ